MRRTRSNTVLAETVDASQLDPWTDDRCRDFLVINTVRRLQSYHRATISAAPIEPVNCDRARNLVLLPKATPDVVLCDTPPFECTLDRARIVFFGPRAFTSSASQSSLGGAGVGIAPPAAASATPRRLPAATNVVEPHEQTNDSSGAMGHHAETVAAGVVFSPQKALDPHAHGAASLEPSADFLTPRRLTLPADGEPHQIAEESSSVPLETPAPRPPPPPEETEARAGCASDSRMPAPVGAAVQASGGEPDDSTGHLGCEAIVDVLVSHYQSLLSRGVVLDRFNQRELAFAWWIVGRDMNVAALEHPAIFRRESMLITIRNFYYELLKRPKQARTSSDTAQSDPDGDRDDHGDDRHVGGEVTHRARRASAPRQITSDVGRSAKRRRLDAGGESEEAEAEEADEELRSNAVRKRLRGATEGCDDGNTSALVDVDANRKSATPAAAPGKLTRDRRSRHSVGAITTATRCGAAKHPHADDAGNGEAESVVDQRVDFNPLHPVAGLDPRHGSPGETPEGGHNSLGADGPDSVGVPKTNDQGNHEDAKMEGNSVGGADGTVAGGGEKGDEVDRDSSDTRSSSRATSDDSGSSSSSSSDESEGERGEGARVQVARANQRRGRIFGIPWGSTRTSAVVTRQRTAALEICAAQEPTAVAEPGSDNEVTDGEEAHPAETIEDNMPLEVSAKQIAPARSRKRTRAVHTAVAEREARLKSGPAISRRGAHAPQAVGGTVPVAAAAAAPPVAAATAATPDGVGTLRDELQIIQHRIRSRTAREPLYAMLLTKDNGVDDAFGRLLRFNNAHALQQDAEEQRMDNASPGARRGTAATRAYPALAQEDGGGGRRGTANRPSATASGRPVSALGREDGFAGDDAVAVCCRASRSSSVASDDSASNMVRRSRSGSAEHDAGESVAGVSAVVHGVTKASEGNDTPPPLSAEAIRSLAALGFDDLSFGQQCLLIWEASKLLEPLPDAGCGVSSSPRRGDVTEPAPTRSRRAYDYWSEPIDLNRLKRRKRYGRYRRTLEQSLRQK